MTLSNKARPSVVPPAGFEPALPPPATGTTHDRPRLPASYLGLLFASCVTDGLPRSVVRSTRHSTPSVLPGRARGPRARGSRRRLDCWTYDPEVARQHDHLIVVGCAELGGAGEVW